MLPVFICFPCIIRPGNLYRNPVKAARQQVQERKAEMDKEKKEMLAQKKSNEMFNSITEKVKPENQNQTHNSRREGMGPNTKRKPN